MFLSPRRESNPQPSDLRWDALTIEHVLNVNGDEIYANISALGKHINKPLKLSSQLHE